MSHAVQEVAVSKAYVPLTSAGRSIYVLIAVELCLLLSSPKRLSLFVTPSWNPLAIIGMMYLLCLVPVLCEVKKYSFTKSENFRLLLSWLHWGDGLVAFAMGLSFYYKNQTALVLCVLCSCKFFFIFVMSRVVTGNTPEGLVAEIDETTRNFVHHVGSFFFLPGGLFPVVLITAVWRLVSMSGHALIASKKWFSTSTYDQINWKLTHLRSATVVSIFGLCLISPSIRLGFAESAVGHITYLVVRLSPVFRLGSLYLDEKDKVAWHKLNTNEKIVALVQRGEHKWLGFELLQMVVMIVFFGTLRCSLFFADVH